MKLHNLPKLKNKKKRRIGRGYGSTKGGHTVGKGMKGQKSRTGFKKLRSWIRTSGVRSLPKLRGVGKRSARRGYFKSKCNKYVLNVSDLENFAEGTVVNRAFLKEQNIISNKSKKATVKILGNGTLTKKFTVQGIDVSKTAQKKIEAAGGKIVK